MPPAAIGGSARATVLKWTRVPGARSRVAGCTTSVATIDPSRASPGSANRHAREPLTCRDPLWAQQDPVNRKRAALSSRLAAAGDRRALEARGSSEVVDLLAVSTPAGAPIARRASPAAVLERAHRWCYAARIP